MTALGYGLIYTGAAVFIIGTIRHRWRLTLADTAANALIAAGWALVPDWFLAAFAGIVTVVCLWTWWRRNKERRRALRELGARSRARIAAMVTRMRERPARPVLRPVPAGAPWGPPGSDWRRP